jgi:hypothetical protein
MTRIINNNVRPIEEILKVFLVRKNEKFFETGLCKWASVLALEGVISYKEKQILFDYMNKNPPDNILRKMEEEGHTAHASEYTWWKEGDIVPRRAWIREQLKSLKIQGL